MTARALTNAEVAAIVMPPWDETRCRVCGWPLHDAAARGCTRDNCSLRPVPTTRADEPPDFLHDDALALAVLVPFIMGRGLQMEVKYVPLDDVRITVLTLDDEIVMEVETDGPNALAAACCQVVVAVSEAHR